MEQKEAIELEMQGKLGMPGRITGVRGVRCRRISVCGGHATFED